MTSLTEAISKARRNSAAPGSAAYLPRDEIDKLVDHQMILSELEFACKEINDEDRQALSKYMIEKAKILFALMAETDAVKLAPDLIKFKLRDDYLPILWDESQMRAKSVNGASKDDGALSWFSINLENRREHRRWINAFCRAQWEFLAPVFTDCEIVYPLHSQCPLPFTKYSDEPSTGANSFLAKGRIDSGHWRTLRRKSEEAMVSDAVAVKRISNQHELTDKWVQVEVVALELVRNLRHNHLINFITSYRQAGSHYLMFEWANGGNLKEFWERNTPGKASQQRDTIIWAIKQMAGLAAALQKLHSEGKHGVHCRHGDLKPANIVRSETPDDPKSHGHFRITDMGVAKVNDRATFLAPTSGTFKFTIRYQSPEFRFRVRPDVPTGRAYDMWSMGCILLEWVIWLLYGPTKLEAFNNSFADSFFSGHPMTGTKIPNSEVSHWINHMKRNTLSTEAGSCTSKALRELLDFISEDLLIPDVRPEMKRFTTELGGNVVVDPPADEDSSALKKPRAKSEHLLRLLETIRDNEDSYFLSEAPKGQDHDLEGPLPRQSSIARHSSFKPPVGGLSPFLQVPQSGHHVQDTAEPLWPQIQYAELPKGQASAEQPVRVSGKDKRKPR
jgi:serine/threonine protein kinase